MSEEVIKLLIGNLPTILTAAGVVVTAIGTILLGYLNYKRAGESIEQSKINTVKIEEVHDTVNGKSKELLEATKALAYEKGIKQGNLEAEAEAKKEGE